MRIGKGNEGKTSRKSCWRLHMRAVRDVVAGELTRAGSPPERINVTVNIVMDEVPGQGHLIVESQLRARARVDGIDEERFRRVVEEADAGCPFSVLIKASAKVSIDAELED